MSTIFQYSFHLGHVTYVTSSCVSGIIMNQNIPGAVCSWWQRQCGYSVQHSGLIKMLGCGSLVGVYLHFAAKKQHGILAGWYLFAWLLVALHVICAADPGSCFHQVFIQFIFNPVTTHHFTSLLAQNLTSLFIVFHSHFKMQIRGE